MKLNGVVGRRPALLDSLALLQAALGHREQRDHLPAAHHGHAHPRGHHRERTGAAIEREALADAEQVGPPHPEVDHRQREQPQVRRHQRRDQDAHQPTEQQYTEGPHEESTEGVGDH